MTQLFTAEALKYTRYIGGFRCFICAKISRRGGSFDAFVHKGNLEVYPIHLRIPLFHLRRKLSPGGSFDPTVHSGSLEVYAIHRRLPLFHLCQNLSPGRIFCHICTQKKPRSIPDTSSDSFVSPAAKSLAGTDLLSALGYCAVMEGTQRPPLTRGQSAKLTGGEKMQDSCNAFSPSVACGTSSLVRGSLERCCTGIRNTICYP